MIGDFGFRPRTLMWLLITTFTIGAGIALVQEAGHREIRYPLTVVAGDPEVQAMRLRADSIMAVRLARAQEPVDINSATAADFERLDGIGPVLARRLVEYREQHGRYASVDELDNVSGIGPKRLEAIRDKCTVGKQETGDLKQEEEELFTP